MRKRTLVRPLQSIDGAALANVVGGRITPRKGVDPAVITGIQTLAKTIAEVGQQMAAQKQAGSQQLMSLMQQLKQARGG
jgi:hypothetical protein